MNGNAVEIKEKKNLSPLPQLRNTFSRWNQVVQNQTGISGEAALELWVQE